MPKLILMLFDDLLDSPKPPKYMVYSYTDGNNNSYYITTSQLVYSPVSPLHSSSGTYSGGAAATQEIDLANYQKIKQLFDAIALQKDIQISGRPKGCGTLSFEQDNRTIYIQANCTEKQELENLLKAILA